MEKYKEPEIIKEAKKYNTIKEWRSNLPYGKNTYWASIRKGKKFHNFVLKNLSDPFSKNVLKDRKWSKKSIYLQAKKYSSLKDWRSDYPIGTKTYHASLSTKGNFHNELCKKLNFIHFWNKERIIKEASKYKSKKDWRKKSEGAYRYAIKDKLLFNLATKHMKNPHFKWSKNKILADALKYKTKKEWIMNSATAFRKSHDLNITDQASLHFEKVGNLLKRCVYTISVYGKKIIYIGLTFNFNERIKSHLKTRRFKDLIKVYGKKSLIINQVSEYIEINQAQKLEIKLVKKFKNLGYSVLNIAKAGGAGGMPLMWTPENIILDANKYKILKDWRVNSGGAYAAALRINIISKVTSHMIRNINPGSPNAGKKLKYQNSKFSENKKEILLDAKKYSLKTTWITKSKAAYKYARDNGFYEEATKHMFQKKKWDNKSVLAEGSKFKNRSDWNKNSAGSFRFALKHRLIKTVFPVSYLRNKY